MTSWLYVAFTIPAILLSPLAGVYVDRWSNKAILIISNLARGCFCQSGSLVPSITHSTKLCLLLAFLYFRSFTIFWSGRNSIHSKIGP